MNNVVVAYISKCSFRSLRHIRDVLGDAFEPTGMPFERAFPDEPEARRAMEELLARSSTWAPEDVMLLERDAPSTLAFEEAVALASATRDWTQHEDNVWGVPLSTWRLRITDMSRCVAILVSVPGPSIGGAFGFLVDKQHRHVIFRYPQEVARFIVPEAIVDTTVGEFLGQ